jgi:hypothetical protein
MKYFQTGFTEARMRHLSIALLTAALAACSSNSTTGSDAQLQSSQTVTQREVGKAFEMKIGESFGINDLKLTFRSVEADSRCPIDAVCVWAGDGEIALKIEQGSQSAVASLHTMLEPKKTEWNGYTISLVTLTPVRQANKPVEPKDYRAQILVER